LRLLVGHRNKKLPVIHSEFSALIAEKIDLAIKKESKINEK
jgi:hypothetical protein